MIHIAALALIAQLVTAPEVNLTDFCPGSGCPPFGSAGDWSAIIDTALQSDACAPSTSTQDYRRSCTLRFPAGVVRTSSTVHLCRPTRIVGAGHGAGRGSTTIEFTGSAGVVHHFDAPVSSVPGVSCPWGSGTHVTSGGGGLFDIALQAAPGSSQAETRWGVDAYASVTYERVHLQGFGSGMRIRGHVHGGLGNANGFQLQRVTIDQVTHKGLVVSGDDANAWTIQAVSVSNACFEAGAWSAADPYRCVAVELRPSINGLVLGLVVSFAWDHGLGASNVYAHHPSLFVDGHVTLIDVYEEANVRGSYMHGGALLISGTVNGGRRCSGNAAPCWVSSECANPSWTCENRLVGSRIAHAKLDGGPWRLTNGAGGVVIVGDYDADTPMSVEIPGIGSSNIRLRWDRLTNTWGWRQGGAGAGGMAVTGAGAKALNGTALKSGRTWLGRNGEHYVGRTSAVAAEVTGAAPDPNAVGTSYPVGSTYRNLRPKAGEVFSWILVCSSSAAASAAGDCGANTKVWTPLSRVGGP